MGVYKYKDVINIKLKARKDNINRAQIDTRNKRIAELIAKKEDEVLETRTVRCRTIGDMTCTGVVLSEANTMDEIVAEVAASRQTERGNRADDKRSESAMEDRKKEGYF